MTKTYAIKRLLEHGPMTRAEIIECTGWSMRVVERALQQTMRTNQVEVCGRARIGDRRVGFTYRAAGLGHRSVGGLERTNGVQAPPGRGSFPGVGDAGNSRPGLGLFHGAPKGVK